MASYGERGSQREADSVTDAYSQREGDSVTGDGSRSCKISKGGREPLYDVAKGIGILTVVYGHLGIMAAKSLVYMFHMPLFFFLSGLLHRRRPIGNMVRRKTVSLMVPYVWAFIIFSVVDLVWLKLYLFKDFTLLSTRQSTGPLWFLWALFVSCILYETMILCVERVKRLRERKLYMLICLGVICLICSIAGYQLSLHKLRLPFYLNAVLTLIPFYGAGHLIAESGWFDKFVAKIKGLRGVWPAVATVAAVMMLIGLDYLVAKMLKLGINDIVANKVIQNWWLFATGCAIGIMTIFLMSAALLKAGRLGSFFVMLGGASLYVMAIHKGVINIAVHYIGKPTVTEWIVIGISSVAVSLLTRKLIKYVRHRRKTGTDAATAKAT